jgi:hypothetical protein
MESRARRPRPILAAAVVLLAAAGELLSADATPIRCRAAETGAG